MSLGYCGGLSKGRYRRACLSRVLEKGRDRVVLEVVSKVALEAVLRLTLKAFMVPEPGTVDEQSPYEDCGRAKGAWRQHVLSYYVLRRCRSYGSPAYDVAYAEKQPEFLFFYSIHTRTSSTLRRQVYHFDVSLPPVGNLVNHVTRHLF